MPSVHAETYTETFSGDLNPAIWTVHTDPGASVTVENGRLKCTVPQHDPYANAYIESTFSVGSVFSSQVDYTLTESLVASSGRPVSRSRTCMHARQRKPGIGDCWEANFYGNYNYAVAGNLVGSVLLARGDNGVAFGDYNVGSGWQQIAAYGDGADGHILLGLFSWPAGSGTTAYFDNFSITSANAPTPEPSTSRSSAPGHISLLGYAWRRRKRE